MNIRDYKDNDSQNLKSILEHFLKEEIASKLEGTSEEDLNNVKTAYANTRDIILVAEEDNQAIGFIAIKEESEETALIRRLLIHQGYRQRKFGTNLLHRGLDIAKIKGYKNISFRSTELMKPILSLLLKNGFKEKSFQEIEGHKIIELSKDIEK
jgi:N-acetylglutamate synthase-like GNAT family acetyltransferase